MPQRFSVVWLCVCCISMRGIDSVWLIERPTSKCWIKIEIENERQSEYKCSCGEVNELFSRISFVIVVAIGVPIYVGRPVCTIIFPFSHRACVRLGYSRCLCVVVCYIHQRFFKSTWVCAVHSSSISNQRKMIWFSQWDEFGFFSFCINRNHSFHCSFLHRWWMRMMNRLSCDKIDYVNNMPCYFLRIAIFNWQRNHHNESVVNTHYTHINDDTNIFFCMIYSQIKITTSM